MNKKINEQSEFNHFQDLSNQWWIPDGQFKILHTITPLRVRYIKKNMKIDSRKRGKLFENVDILDLGCGGGLMCEPLARLGANVTGIDFISNNIKVAKKHAKKSNLQINYLNQDLSSLKFNKKFDLILLLEVIEHLDNWKNVIQQSIQKLKPHGKIIFSTINRNIFSKIFAIYIAENILNWVPKNTHNFNKLIKPEELTNFLDKNNMKTKDITGIYFNPISGEWLLKKNKIKINYFCTAEKI